MWICRLNTAGTQLREVCLFKFSAVFLCHLLHRISKCKLSGRRRSRPNLSVVHVIVVSPPLLLAPRFLNLTVLFPLRTLRAGPG